MDNKLESERKRGNTKIKNILKKFVFKNKEKEKEKDKEKENSIISINNKLIENWGGDEIR